MGFVEDHMRESLKDHVLEELPAGEMKAFYLKKPGNGMMDSCLILFTPEGVVICGDRAPSRTGRGAITAFRYGLDWFASELYEDYLCSKFLDKEWVPEYAVRFCRSVAKETRIGKQDDYGYVDKKKLWEIRAGHSEDLERLRQDIREEKDPEWLWKMKAERKILIARLVEARRALQEVREEAASRYEELAQRLENNECGVEGFAEDLMEIDPGAIEDGVPGYGYPPAEAGWLCAIQQRFREVYKASVEMKA